ncbi:hypothetical protein CesoFtcFv8_006808 [Champsocephalus esox]|uniref:Uncharacterized protein n=1 Tax=Champsocephalus esox TaxID=159716 RepID=A0AAN8H7X3_9TELE|nr:hypothetical protein CesoFtcFv8_006808 [Champsocephalus esox]
MTSGCRVLLCPKRNAFLSHKERERNTLGSSTSTQAHSRPLSIRPGATPSPQLPADWTWGYTLTTAPS